MANTSPPLQCWQLSTFASKIFPEAAAHRMTTPTRKLSITTNQHFLNSQTKVMKQILFRAISKEPETSGQLIYGSIVNLSKPDKKPFYKMRDPDGKYSYIIQDSISQYTGAQDAAGVPIFEGDTIKRGQETWIVPEFILNIVQEDWTIIANKG